MSRARDDRYRSFHERKCFICNGDIPQTKGVYIAYLRILVHHGSCSEIVTAHEKDFTNSKRGRFRSTSDVLRRLRNARAEILKSQRKR
jgi:hypothetical protein